MAIAADRNAWNHTSTILAILFNSNPYRKGRAAKPQHFHPYLRQQARYTLGTRLTKHTLKFLAIAMGATGIPN